MQISPPRKVIARAVTIGAAALLAFSLSGCGALQNVLSGADRAARDAETQEVTAGGQADVFSIMVGDCTNDTTAEEVTEVPVVPCAEPHDNEAYFEVTLPDGEFPGDEEIQILADEACMPAFETFVGISYEASALSYYPLRPTEGSWNELNDRVVLCMIWDEAAQTTGSLAGAAR